MVSISLDQGIMRNERGFAPAEEFLGTALIGVFTRLVWFWLFVMMCENGCRVPLACLGIGTLLGGDLMARASVILVLATLVCISSWLAPPSSLFADEGPIKVGVLHSLSGTMAISERSLVDAISMAIDEINAKGGVLGRRLEAVIEDGASDWPTFASKAEKLIVEDEVASIFGCWTSASRKAVKDVVERHDSLLWYPVQYEGNERSPHIIYTGAAPNQQITPAVEWCRLEFGDAMFLVGSDYVFPRTANEIIKLELSNHGLEPVGEEYRRLGDSDFDAIVAKIKRAQPDVILNTINGGSNSDFFAALKAAGIGPNEIPVMSFSIAEDELRNIGVALTAGHFCSWNYFQSIDTPTNRRFVRAFKARYGAERVTDDPIESAYFQVHVFAKAVERAASTNVADIREAARGLVFAAPEGLIRIDPRNLHTWRVARIGRVRRDGQFKIVWSSKDPLRPRPFLPQAYLVEAGKQGQIIFAEISHMIDLGVAEFAADGRLDVLKAMSEVLGQQGEIRTNFLNAVSSVQLKNREIFEASWKEFDQSCHALSRRMDQFSEPRRESYERLLQAKAKFAANVDAMFEALYSDEFAVEVNP